MHSLFLQLISLGLIKPHEKKSVIFNSQHSNAWDINRVVTGQPFWKHFIPLLKQEVTFKNVIINHAYTSAIHPTDEAVYINLFNSNFVIYIRVDENVYEKAKDISRLKQLLPRVKLTQPEVITSELLYLHKKPEHYHVMDDFLRAQLLKLYNISEQVSTIDTFYVHGSMTRENLNIIAEWLANPNIAYKYIGFSISVPYTFTLLRWRNNFSKQQTQQLLYTLHTGIDIDTFFESDNFYSFAIDCNNDPQYKTFDLLPFKRAEEIHIKKLIPKNLSACQNVKRLQLQNTRNGDVDLSTLSKLEYANFETCQDLSILNTENSLNSPTLRFHHSNEHIEIDTNGNVITFLMTAVEIKDFQSTIQNWIIKNNQAAYFLLSRQLKFDQATKVNLITANIVLDFTEFEKLEYLALYSDRLSEVRGLNHCKNLQFLSLNCPKLSSFKLLTQLQSSNLKQLVIYYPDQTTFQNLPTSLTELVIVHSNEITEIDLSHLTNLTNLDVADCPKLKKIIYANNLRDFSADTCPELEFVSDLGQMTRTVLRASKQVTFIKNTTRASIEIISLASTSFYSQDAQGEITPNIVDLEGQTKIAGIQINSRVPFTIINESRSLDALQASPDHYFMQFMFTRDNQLTNIFPLTVHCDVDPIEDVAIKTVSEGKEEQVSVERSSGSEKKYKDLDLFIYQCFAEYSNQKVNSTKDKLNFNNVAKTTTLPTLLPQKVFDDNQQQPILTATYRKTVYPGLHIDDEGNITPMLAPTQKLVRVYNTSQLTATNSVPGYERIGLIPGEEFILTGLSGADQVELVDNKCFELYLNSNRQYVVKLKADAPAFYGILQYRLQKDPDYFIPFSKTPELDIEKIQKPVLRNHPAYKKVEAILLKVMQEKFDYLIMKFGTPSQKLNEIVQFARKFEQKDPLKNSDNWEKLYEMISEQTGVCSHRSIVAKLYCDLLQIPSSLIFNDEHVYLEVYDQEGRAYGIDLGGGEANVITQPIAKPKEPTKEGKEEITDPMLQETTTNPYESEFMHDIDWVLSASSFDDFASKLIARNGNPLLRTESQEQVFKCYRQFSTYAKEQALDFVYVHNAMDLENLLQPIKIENGFKKCDGPLAQLVEKGNAVILINWNNFSPRERGIYKTLIDDPPTLNVKLLPKGIKVIGFLNNNVQTNDVFNSRTKKIPVPKKLLSENLVIITNEQAEPVNLYHSQDWMRLLVQDISFKGNAVQIHKGKLIEAVEKGLPIEIINPPDDPAFEILRDRLLVEGKIMFNGEMLTAKPGFQLSIRKQPIVLRPPDNFSIKTNTPVPQTGKKYFINHANYSNLFKIGHISAANEIDTIDGILAELKSDDQIILTERLEQAELAFLYNELSKLSPERRTQINIYDIPVEKLKPVVCDTINTIPEHDFNHIETNDPHFVANQLQEIYGRPNQNIFYLTGDNTWANLIENVEIKIDEHGLNVKREESTFWKKLCNGETVTIVGDLSLEDQMMLESLFNKPPYLFVNGERVAVEGKLIWISKPQAVYTPLTKPQINYQATISDYETCLRRELEGNDEERPSKRRKKTVDEDLIAKINIFFEYAKLNKKGKPGPEHFTYEKYRELYHKVLSKPEQTNPVKSILTYHYEKNSEEYAYINVVSKMLFSQSGPRVRRATLEKLMRDVHSPEDFYKNIWRIINCFNGEFIAKNFMIIMPNLTNTPLPKPNTQIMLLVKEAVNRELQQNTEPDIKRERESKQKKRLLEALHSDNQPLVCLFGEAGTGKTYSVRDLHKKKQIQLFEGLDQIKAYASCRDSDPKYKVLYLDEGNMLPAQRLEFLRGLKQIPPILNLDKPLELTEYHKVFLSGNPLSYAGREFHEVLWDCAHLIWYEPFQESFIKAFVTASIEEICPSDKQVEIASIIANFYQSMLGKNPDKTTDITLRDIENITAKLLLYKQNNKFNTWEECAKQAIYAEIHGTLVNHNARERLMKKLQIVPMAYTAIETQNGIIIPDEKVEMWDLIKDDLSLRTNNLNSDSPQPFKRGILLEGASGIGKSTMMLTMLNECGFSINATDPQKHYYILNAGEPNVREILLKAFDEGSIVILNELNLDPDLEDLLNKLLDPNNKGKKPGFMVLATQNPSYYDGCKPLSKALASRMHTVIMNEYSRQALEYIAGKKKHSSPANFVTGFFDVRKKFPGIINTRNFFDALFRSTKIR